jgi:hypothetical protein
VLSIHDSRFSVHDFRGAVTVKSYLIALGGAVAVIGAAFALTSAVGSGQAQGDGPAYRVPRTVDGQPDLQGVWQAVNTAVWDIQDHGAQLGVPAGQGVVEGNEIPYTPEALQQREENRANWRYADPELKCWMVGVPRITYMPYPFEIVQSKKQIDFLYEYVHTSRHMYLDSKHPEGEPGELEWFMGDSRAQWEGDTLVVDVIHFSPETWLDRSGNFHSNALHVVERYTRTGPDHMRYEVTIEDPKVFTRPWRMSMPLYRRQEKNIQLLEYECQAMLEARKDVDQ